MNDQADGQAVARRHSWSQFGLRSLLLVITLSSLLLFGWRTWVRPYQRQQAWMQQFVRNKATFSTADRGLPGIQALFRKDQFRSIIKLDLTSSPDPGAAFAKVAHLPDLEVLAVGDTGLDARQLERLLAIPTLRELLLDSVTLDEQVVMDAQRRHPEVRIVRGARAHHRVLESLGRIEYYPQRRKGLDSFLQAAHSRAAKRVDLSRAFDAKGVARRLQALPYLQTLHLGYNFEDDDARRLGTIKSLRHLYLDRTLISDAGLRQLDALPKLRLLTLGRNVTDDGMSSLRRHQALVFVDVSKTQVTGRGLTVLRDLPHLDKLYVSGRPLDDDDLKTISSIRTLREIRLGNCFEFSDTGVLWLRELPSLTRIDISGTRVTESALAKLCAETHPDLEVRRGSWRRP